MKRIIIFGLLAAILWTAENIWLSARQPEISKALALQQVNGGDSTEQVKFQSEDYLKQHKVATKRVQILAERPRPVKPKRFG